jgi:hypothetical protein
MIPMNKKQVLNHLRAVMHHKQVLILVNLIINLQIRLEKRPKNLLEVYDADKNGEFNKIEIEAALIGLLK